MKIKIRVLIFIICFLVFTNPNSLQAEFISPTQNYLTLVELDQIKYNLKGKGVGLEYRELYDKIIAEEKIGYIGCYGDSLDFFIYQDVIRILVEEVLEIPVRKDFHFLSSPFKSDDTVNTLEDLSKLFVADTYFAQKILDNTFPLNYAIYSNHNCLGLNTVLNFSKNIGDRTKSQRKELSCLFEKLNIDPVLLEVIYDTSKQYLDSQTGVILQVFDNSTTPYNFGNRIAYAAYPNGLIVENKAMSEYFLDYTTEFPQELRLVLDPTNVLNPGSPLTIKRYTKIQPGKLKAWEQKLREIMRASSFDPVKKEELRQDLLHQWNN